MNNVEACIRKAGIFQGAHMDSHSSLLFSVLRGRAAYLDSLFGPPSLFHGFDEHPGRTADIEKASLTVKRTLDIVELYVLQTELHEPKKLCFVFDFITVVVVIVAGKELGPDRLRILIYQSAPSALDEE